MEDRAHSAFSWPAAAAGIQGCTLTHYMGKVTQSSDDKCNCRHYIQEKTLHTLKMCLFGTCWNKNSQEFVVWGLFKSLYDETKQRFLSTFAALPWIGLLPCSPCQQFCTACWASAWAQSLWVNLTLFCLGTGINLENSNWFSSLKLVYFYTYNANAVLCNLMSTSFSAEVGLVFPLQTSVVGLKNLAISTLLDSNLANKLWASI